MPFNHLNTLTYLFDDSRIVNCTFTNRQLTIHESSNSTLWKIALLACLFWAVCLRVSAQTDSVMSVWECIRYAVAHSHGIRQRELQLDNAKAARVQAVGAFLPSLGASASAQLNFGRAIDPETNTYTNVSTFGNGYGLSMSLPLFDGFYRVHALRAARADVLMQKSALQADRDQVALQTYQAFTDVLYAREALLLAQDKLRDSELLLRQTRVMEEEGLKSGADVAQIEAQKAADVLTVTRQENQLESAMLKLKEVMNWQTDEPLSLDSRHDDLINDLTPNPSPRGEGSKVASAGRFSSPLLGRGVGGEVLGVGGEVSPLLLQAYYSVEQARHTLRMARSAFFPSISISAGVNSSFYRNLDATGTPSFRQQLKNNLGEYVGASLSIPIFNRLGTAMSLRRARNNLRIAEEQYAARMTELDVLRRQAQLDVQAYKQESEQWRAKVAADSLAYELVRQQYAQGLASPLDVQTSAVGLLQSRINLLQARLMTGVKEMTQRYYKGEPLVP